MHLRCIKWLWTGVDSHFQWSVDQLMHDQEHGRRCFLCPLFCVAIHVAQIYSGFFHPTPWCITSRCISCSPCRLVIEGPYIANQSNKKTRGLRKKQLLKFSKNWFVPGKTFWLRVDKIWLKMAWSSLIDLVLRVDSKRLLKVAWYRPIVNIQ